MCACHFCPTVASRLPQTSLLRHKLVTRKYTDMTLPVRTGLKTNPLQLYDNIVAGRCLHKCTQQIYQMEYFTH